MSKIKAINSVYAYYYPEVRRLVEKTIKNFSQDLLLKSIFPGLDNYHESFIRKFVKKSAKFQKGLLGFSNQYFVNGSSEGIFHLLVDSIFQNEGKPIYVFKGDYEGYREYTKNLGGQVTEIPFNAGIKELPKGRWFISNPSAIDGNIIPNKVIQDICDLGHEVVLDLSYLGTTREYLFDLTHPNVIAVFVSLSKPFGLFYYRLGITFSRKPLLTLYPNIWFKNILSITIGKAILDKFGVGYFYKKYKPLQEKAIKYLEKETNLKVIPSDVLLLANAKFDVGRRDLTKFQRGDRLRFCLTPYFLDSEKTTKKAVHF